MPDAITEWEFTADVARWIQQILDGDPDLPFSEAKCEKRAPDSEKRRDLTLVDKDRRNVLTGEVKLPFRPKGGTPYNEEVVEDTRQKAKRAKVDFFFTWNVNEFVLWETFPAHTPRTKRAYRSWQVTSVHREDQLDIEPTRHAIQSWLASFLREFARIFRDRSRLGLKPPDEQFVDALESALKLPILLNFEALLQQYKKPPVKLAVDSWMVSLGWTISSDPEELSDLLQNASKFACYSLVTKLVFHEALLKRYGAEMLPLRVPEHIDRADALCLHLEGFFDKAITVTRDYETVFGEERSSIGSRIPFYSDHAVPHWRELINEFHRFDFSKLDYEVIGSVFERLIAPEKRRQYGQYYTCVEVVDLINSFCIRTGAERIMDPACGGGTFLVRAYGRKRELAPSRSHGETLADLFGVDISHFATDLATINLATRDLIDEENYPQIARSDFFDVEPQKALMRLPTRTGGRLRTSGLGEGQRRDVRIPALDAVVGNPPYIRQERIPRAKKAHEREVEHGTKEFYLDRAVEGGAHLSARSDIHGYFWPHAAGFLKEEGYLCFITSSQWLDVEYGFRLQEWMLRHFEIVAIFESIDEPWFVGARVTTAVTVLRRQKDETKRQENLVRFVQLRRPIREILAHDGTSAGARLAADAFRDEILGLTANAVNDRYRVRLVSQRDLWRQGVRLGAVMGKTIAEDREDEEGATQGASGEYYGGKWGVYLRAPDLWFDLLDRFGDRLVPLADVADVHRGITSGKDCFFFPIDCSAERLAREPNPAEFESRYGVPRDAVKSGKVRLVRCGEGLSEVRPIEARYLQPVVYSVIDSDTFEILPKECQKQVVLIGEERAALAGTYAHQYIEWGESRGYHEGSDPASPVGPGREWYNVTGHKPGLVLWPCAHQYKHVALANPRRLICNQRLFDVAQEGMGGPLLAGLLNSSLVLLAKFQHGRPVGVEGKLGTGVVDVRMMVVPDPRQAAEPARRRVAAAFRAMKGRKTLYFLSERRLREMAYRAAGKEAELASLPDLCELDMADRRELDDAVFEMLGERSKVVRAELIDALYARLREFFEQVRRKEEKALANKKRAKRRGAVRPAEIAAQIYEEIQERQPPLLHRYDLHFLDASKPFDTYEVPLEGAPARHNRLFNGVVFAKGRKTVKVLETATKAQDELITLLARCGIRGLVRVPHSEKECQLVLLRYSELVGRRESCLRELIQLRTADEEMQAKIYEILMPMFERPR